MERWTPEPIAWVDYRAVIGPGMKVTGGTRRKAALRVFGNQ
jgi:hypothetical protein